MLIWLSIALVVAALTERVITSARQAGLDPARRSGAIRLIVRGFLVGLLTIAALRELIVVAPVLTAIAAGLTGAVASLFPFRRLPGLISGARLEISGRLKEGDDVAVEAGPSGRVERLGLFETHLRRLDGALVTVATHRLAARAVAITPGDAPRLVVARVVRGMGERSPSVDRVRERAWLCPYRAPNTDVVVRTTQEGLDVTLFAWPGAERFVEAYVSRQE